MLSDDPTSNGAGGVLAVAPVCPNGALGPAVATIVDAAAKGNLESQRYLFQDRVDALFNPNTTHENAMLIAMEAVLFGRLIASHRFPPDIRRFAGVLCQASYVFRNGGRQDISSFLIAESVSVLEQLAECGDDIAALSSQALVADHSTQLLDHVRALRKRATENQENS